MASRMPRHSTGNTANERHMGAGGSGSSRNPEKSFDDAQAAILRRRQAATRATHKVPLASLRTSSQKGEKKPRQNARKAVNLHAEGPNDDSLPPAHGEHREERWSWPGLSMLPSDVAEAIQGDVGGMPMADRRTFVRNNTMCVIGAAGLGPGAAQRLELSASPEGSDGSEGEREGLGVGPAAGAGVAAGGSSAAAEEGTRARRLSMPSSQHPGVLPPPAGSVLTEITARAEVLGIEDAALGPKPVVKEKPPGFDFDERATLLGGFVSAAVVSRGGRERGSWKKENQDTYILGHPCGGERDGGCLLAVFDGHGPNGRLVSTSVRQSLCKKLAADSVFYAGPAEAFHRHFVDTHEEVTGRLDSKARMSGSTGVVLAVDGDYVHAAWVGDSRAIIGRLHASERGVLEALEVTRDHKPEVPEEHARVVACNGRVDRLVTKEGEQVGPYRVFLKYSWSPGLSTSRAFGDTLGHEVGISAEPDKFSHELDPRDRFAVVASDGVWEFLSNERVLEIVKGCGGDAHAAAEAVVGAARAEWAAHESSTTDDITAVVAFFDHSKRPSLVAGPLDSPSNL